MTLSHLISCCLLSSLSAFCVVLVCISFSFRFIFVSFLLV